MARTLDEVRQAVNELSPEDREILAIELGLEMEKVDPEIEKAWIEEAKRRWKEFEEGKVEGIPAEEVFTRVKQKLHEARNH
jgi:putative addiction module component (TIGR02574 family)